MACLGDLDAACVQRIYRGCGSKDLALGMCVSKTFHAALSDEKLWEECGTRVWGITEKLGPRRKPAESYRSAVAMWEAKGLEVGDRDVFQRVAKAWAMIEAFFEPYPDILQIIRSGKSLEDSSYNTGPFGHLTALAAVAGTKIKYPVFGSYEVYNVFAQVEPAIDLNRVYMERVDGIDYYLKRMCTVRKTISGSFDMLCRKDNVPFMRDSDGCYLRLSPDGQGLVSWLEEYALRLSQGCYEFVASPVEDGMMLLSQFPQLERLGFRKKVTQGIEVSVSPLLLPMLYRQGKWTFAYKVGFRLLSIEEQEESWTSADGSFIGQCQVQLETRRWVILSPQGEELEIVEGPGVIGQYPVLSAGGEKFCYQSCTHTQRDPWDLSSACEPGPSLKGKMTGHFNFRTEDGKVIAAQCPLFELRVPDFIY